MKLERNTLDLLQEQHLDDLIRLALRYTEAAEVQAILEKFDRLSDNAADVDEKQRQATFARAMEKLDRAAAAARKAERRASRRRNVTRFMEVAAVILLLLAIAAPIAVANIDALRNEFAYFFFPDIAQEGDLTVDYRRESNERFPYYAGYTLAWGGLYLPEYIPEGYEHTSTQHFGAVLYLGFTSEEAGDMLRMSERLEPPEVLEDVVEARWVEISGSSARVEQTASGDTVVTWFNGERWYRLRSGKLPEEELLRVAGSLAPYMGEESMALLQAEAVERAAIPEGYSGLFFPTWLPEGFRCTGCEDSSGMTSADFSDGSGNALFWLEAYGDVSILDGNSDTMQTIDVNGITGQMYISDEVISIIWMNDLRMFHVKSSGVAAEDMLRLVRSVRMIDHGTAQQSIRVETPAPTATPAPALTLADWGMPYVPTWCPEGCFTPYITYQGPTALLCNYENADGIAMELIITTSEMPWNNEAEYLLSIPADVNGCEGTLTLSPQNAGSIDLRWSSGDAWFHLSNADTASLERRVDDMLQLARSIRRGTPEEIPHTAAENTQEAVASAGEPFHCFPMTLLDEYRVTSAEHALGELTQVMLYNEAERANVTLLQLSDRFELLNEGGPTFNAVRADMEIGGRKVTVYTPAEGAVAVNPTMLMWQEDGWWYMLVSTQPHEALYRIVECMVPVDPANTPAMPTIVPTATPAPGAAVPAEWASDYYLTRLPDGCELVSASAYSAVYEDADGRRFVFSVMPEDWNIEEVTRGAVEAYSVLSRGQWSLKVRRFSEERFCTVEQFIFQVDGHWFSFESDLTMSTYANYVQKISQ